MRAFDRGSRLGARCTGGAQLAGGRSAFNQRPSPEPVQFWGDRFWGDRRPSYPNNSHEPYNPFYRRPQVYEFIKPPAPRKVETPPTETVVVIGDLFGDWLGYGLELVFAETPEIGIVRKIKPDLGLVRDDVRLDAPEWSHAIRDFLAAETPSVIVVMLGVNDRLPLRDRVPATKGTTTPPPDNDHPAATAAEAQRPPPGGKYEFHTDKWAELYAKRIDDMIAALKSKGVPVLWVGMPAIRGTKSTSDMSYLDELYRARAEKAGIIYDDIWDGFVDDQGRYALQGPDFEGQTRRLRTYDGVYFTKYGADKLAHYVEHDLRRGWPTMSCPSHYRVRRSNHPKGRRRRAPGHRLGRASQCDRRRRGRRPLGRHERAGGTGSRSARDAGAQQRRRDRGAAGRADDFSWPRAHTSGAADVGPSPDATPPKGSAG